MMSRRKIAIAAFCSVNVIVAMVLSNSDGYRSQQGNALRFSQEAMEVMGNAEGCRRDAYLCPARIRTQGIGHTRRVSGTVTQADDRQIARWFAEDQLDAQNCFEQNVERKLGMRLPQSVFDGVGSFMFNVGYPPGQRDGAVLGRAGVVLIMQINLLLTGCALVAA